MSSSLLPSPQFLDPTQPLQAANKEYVDARLGPGSAVILGGPTANRPPSPAMFQGYFDTTLGYPVWWNGTLWDDASADFVNVLLYGADPTGAADSTPAFLAALATTQTVYMPRGNYKLTDMITVGNDVAGSGVAQTLFGDGHDSCFIIGPNFNPNAICVVLIRGAEAFRAHIHDIRISFAQPTTTNGSVTRSTFLTLAQGGNLNTGIAYPPAIMWGNDSMSANRFRIERVRVEAAWDGLVQGQYGTGGFIIDDVEVGALNNGLVIGDIGDHSQVRSYHAWNFGLTGDVQAVRFDGQTVGIQLGNAQTGNQAAGITFSNIQIFQAKLNIDAYGGGGIHFTNLQMDGTNSAIEMSAGDHCHISNIYFSNGLGMLQPCIWMKPGAGGNYGRLFIENIFGWHADQPMIQMDCIGVLKVRGGYIYPATTAAGTVPTVVQTAGWLQMSDITIGGSGPTAPVQVHGNSTIDFHDNIFPGQPTSSVPIMTIDNDNFRSQVVNNFFGGGLWTFTPPGPQGIYGPNNMGVMAGTSPNWTNRQWSGAVNPTLSCYFGTAPPYSTGNIFVVSQSGGLHIAQGLGELITDTSTALIVGGAFIDNSGQGVSNPASGSTSQIPDNCGLYFIETVGTASLTVILPVNPRPNQQLRIWSSGNIPNFTLLPSPGQTLPVAPGSITANRSLLFVWSSGPWFMLTGG